MVDNIIRRRKRVISWKQKALQLRDSGISVHNVQDIHNAQPIKIMTKAQHYSMALSGSSPLQTCLEEARIASAEMPTATVSGLWTYVLVREQVTVRLMWERGLQ